MSGSPWRLLTSYNAQDSPPTAGLPDPKCQHCLLKHFLFQISEMCCEAVKKLFKQDKLGQASLGVIKVISGFVKGRNYEVRPEVSLSFLTLKFVLNYEVNFLLFEEIYLQTYIR